MKIDKWAVLATATDLIGADAEGVDHEYLRAITEMTADLLHLGDDKDHLQDVLVSLAKFGERPTREASLTRDERELLINALAEARDSWNRKSVMSQANAAQALRSRLIGSTIRLEVR